jgi:16S rRNA (adenine1518-N6/adenine1519-N6)-dimethyltransferase
LNSFLWGRAEPISLAPLDLSSEGTVRAVARRFGIQFRPRRGQNFLVDRTQLDRLVEALELSSTDRLLEIGPGLGVLTRELAKSSAEVTAVEIDPACVRALGLTLSGIGNVRVVEGDILRHDPGELVKPPYRVIGNIPYSITGALMVHLLEQADLPEQIDVVVQREVAERLAAPPGAWSLATLGVRVYGQAELLLTIPKESFYPQPKVSSSLLRIRPDPEPALPRSDLPAFFGFARGFFQVRRKQLSFVVARGLDIDKAGAREQLRMVGIDPARRAETLTLDEWRRLFASFRPNWKLDMMQAR